jgi:hypothetical protein
MWFFAFGEATHVTKGFVFLTALQGQREQKKYANLLKK